MPNKMKKFLQVFKAELEELEDDLAFFGELYKKREESGEITPYVYLENTNLIKNEISGIQEIVRSVDDLVSTQYTDFEEMVEDLDSKIKKRIKESDYAAATYEFIKRKLQKVHKYIMSET